VLNPRASNGEAARRWPEIEAAMRRHWPNLGVRRTEAREHARTLARKALEDGASMVVSVGGDGTNNEVLWGFVDEEGKNRFPDATLGVIAAGTGGDFQRLFGTLDPVAQVERLAEAKPRTIDYGIASFVGHTGEPIVRPFLNVASMGISGLVDRYINTGGRALGNTVSYVTASLRGIANWKNRAVELEFEGREPREVDLSLLVLGNGQYFGAGMWACPNAELDDGMLDTILLAGFRRRSIVAVLARVYRGRHLGFPGLEDDRVSGVSLRPRLPGTEVLIDLDGEQPGRLPAQFTVAKRGLRVQVA
jgi:YegS/Rv2252/BmrU family lipid kinase